MKRVRRPEKDHLRRLGCGREMHRRRVNRHKKTRLRDERRKGKQIRVAGKIDDWGPQFGFDLTNMFLLDLRSAAGQNKIDIVISARVIDHIGPAPRFPKFFHARRAWMENNEGIVDLCITAKLFRFFARGPR